MITKDNVKMDSFNMVPKPKDMSMEYLFWATKSPFSLGFFYNVTWGTNNDGPC